LGVQAGGWRRGQPLHRGGRRGAPGTPAKAALYFCTPLSNKLHGSPSRQILSIWFDRFGPNTGPCCAFMACVEPMEATGAGLAREARQNGRNCHGGATLERWAGQRSNVADNRQCPILPHRVQPWPPACNRVWSSNTNLAMARPCGRNSAGEQARVQDECTRLQHAVAYQLHALPHSKQAHTHTKTCCLATPIS
jgi:hypothetical protein